MAFQVINFLLHPVDFHPVPEEQGFLPLLDRLQVLFPLAVQLRLVLHLQFLQLTLHLCTLCLYIVAILVELLHPELPGLNIPLFPDLLLVNFDQLLEFLLL